MPKRLKELIEEKLTPEESKDIWMWLDSDEDALYTLMEALAGNFE